MQYAVCILYLPIIFHIQYYISIFSQNWNRTDEIYNLMQRRSIPVKKRFQNTCTKWLNYLESTGVNMNNNSTITEKQCFILHTTRFDSGVNSRLYFTFDVFIIVFLFISNGMMAVGLWKTNKKFTLSHTLLFFQCLVDFGNAIVVTPVQLVAFKLSASGPCFIAVLNAFVSNFTPAIAVLTLWLLIIIRYYKIARGRDISRKHVYAGIAFALVSEAGISFWYAFVIYRYDRKQHIIFNVITGTVLATCLMTTTICNIKLYLYIKGAANNIRGHCSQASRDETDISRTILIMSTTMILCFIPITIVLFISAYLLLNGTDISYVILWPYSLILINSGLNSMIFISRTKRMKCFWILCASRMWRRCCSKRSQTATFVSYTSDSEICISSSTGP